MSKLTELWKSISTTLHLPELTKPLWEQTIKQVDDHEARLVKLEATPAAALPAELLAQLNQDWQDHVARTARINADDAALKAEQEAAVAAIAKAAEEAAAATAAADKAEQEAVEAKAAETEQAALEAAAAAKEAEDAVAAAGTKTSST